MRQCTNKALIPWDDVAIELAEYCAVKQWDNVTMGLRNKEAQEAPRMGHLGAFL